MTEQACIQVYGQVQMVGFRYFALRQAQLRGITGYVRNMFDGSVEILAQGETETLSSFISALREGPVSAQVERIELNRGQEAQTQYSTFSVRR